MMEFSHIPVLQAEVVEYLNIDPEGIYLDGTAGGGGHSLAIANSLTTGMLYSLDRDGQAVYATQKRLNGCNAKVIKANFRDAETVLARFGITGINGALLDLGVSSYQLDCGERGFSYSLDAELDMRMDEYAIDAKTIVNTFSKQELTRIIYKFGEEKYAGFIATKIVKAREKKEIKTTFQLSEIIISALPPSVRRKEKNPAKKTFQAIRIAANDEFAAIKEGLFEIFNLLLCGGRFCVISFHSLEDRLVKEYFKTLFLGCICPKDLPVCVCNNKPKAKPIVKFISPDENEISINKRARSAKLRVIEKL